RGELERDVTAELGRAGLPLALGGPDHRGGDQVVAMLGPAWRSIAHHDFDPARLDQVIEVAPRGNAAQAGEIGNLHCRQVAAGLVQDAGDEVEGWPRQALGECFATTLPE